MVHIDPAVLRKYPILGVLLGLSTAIFVGHLLRAGLDEARALLGQEAPDVVSVGEASNLHGIRWIRLSDGQWHCNDALVLERKGLTGRWLWGRIESTEVPITGDVEGELLVARFKGDVSCAARAHTELTGVVGSFEIFTSRAALRRWSGMGRRVVIMNVDASPSRATGLLLGIGALMIGAIVFSGYYVKLLLVPNDRQAANPSSNRPIEPT